MSVFKCQLRPLCAILFKTSMRYLIVMPIILVMLLPSCKVTYSFSGANTGSLSTVSVQYFPNRAAIVKPTLSQYFTDELRDVCQRQTRLTLVNGYGDANFEGEIRTYNTRPVAITGDDVASLTRLSIGIRVKYTNNLDPSQNFEETFTHYEDFDSSKTLDAVEDELIGDIVDRLVEDIFNRAFVNW